MAWVYLLLLLLPSSNCSSWSPCSRTCGGGVTRQMSTGALRICNVESCPNQGHKHQFRREQCQQFNHIPYQGKYYYAWQEHIEEKSQNPCALYCLTKDTTPATVAMLKEKVVDGTRCGDRNLGLCVDGQCESVGCDLAIGSDQIVDSCGVCGGRNDTCDDNNRSYVWHESPLSKCSAACGGHGRQMVGPKCVLNSNKDVVVDDTFCPREKRPAMRLQICNSQPCPPRWEVGDWGECSRSCGSGLQHRLVVCVADHNGARIKIEETRCPSSIKPDTQQRCGEQPCPSWHVGRWSECKALKCESTVGEQRRSVLCHRDNRTLDVGCSILNKPTEVRPCAKPTVFDENDNCNDTNHWTRMDNNNEKFGDNDDFDQVLRPMALHADPVRQQQKHVEAETGTGSDSPTGTGSSVTSQPSFVTSPWSECSATCGQGLRKRSVECKMLLQFSRTVAKLPDKSCPGLKPSSTELCYASSACDSNPGSASSPTLSALRPKFVWLEMGFTVCSESCLGGLQESKVACVESRLKTIVSPVNCKADLRPETRFRTCNDHPCPPRWNVSQFGPCSTSCGSGVQTREVECIQEVRHGASNVLSLPASQCPQPPPINRQFCNVIDCPLQWEASKWSSCQPSCASHSNEMGHQKREIGCTQKMALGQIAQRSSEQCRRELGLFSRPKSTRSCNKLPPCHLLHVDSSKISQNLIKSDEKQEFVQKEATLTSNKSRIVVKLRVGGRAQLIAGTTLRIKCPVKKVNRKHIEWSRDGITLPHTLASSGRRSRALITPRGVLKIKRIKVTDSGVYTCTAKHSSASLVVKVRPNSTQISEKRKKSNDKEENDKNDKSEIRESNEISSQNSLLEPIVTTTDPHRLLYPMRFHQQWQNEEKIDIGSTINFEQEEQNRHQVWATFEATVTTTLEPWPTTTTTTSSSSSSSLSTWWWLSILLTLSLSLLKFEWKVSAWGLCKAKCGHEGRQHRSVTCVSTNSSSTMMSIEKCLESGAGPETSRSCVAEMCEDTEEWVVHKWTSCSLSPCVARRRARQSRLVYCTNESSYNEVYDNKKKEQKERHNDMNKDYGENDMDDNEQEIKCGGVIKPRTTRTCYSRYCLPTWSSSEWSQCSSTNCDEGEGIQARVNTCVWQRDLRPAPQRLCSRQTRPPTTRSCLPPCPSERLEECEGDAFHYCGLARTLGMCGKPKYSRDCCHSCR